MTSPGHPFYLRSKGQKAMSAWVCTLLSGSPIISPRTFVLLAFGTLISAQINVSLHLVIKLFPLLISFSSFQANSTFVIPSPYSLHVLLGHHTWSLSSVRQFSHASGLTVFFGIPYCTSVVEQTSPFPSGPLSVWFISQLPSVLRLQPKPVSWYVPFSAQDLSLFQVFSSLVPPSTTDWLLGKWIGMLLVVFGVVNL